MSLSRSLPCSSHRAPLRSTESTGGPEGDHSHILVKRKTAAEQNWLKKESERAINSNRLLITCRYEDVEDKVILTANMGEAEREVLHSKE